MRGTVRALAGLFVVLAVPGLASNQARPIDSGYSRQTAYATGDPALDRLQDLFRPTLEANRKELTGRTGAVKAFGAGARYPQVWLRDSATLIPLARYHYPGEYLMSWLEEHLANQAEDGGLDDWIAAGPVSEFVRDAPRARQVFRAGAAVLTADKNTVEADQESSAVLGVCQAFRITGDRAWLRKPIGGVPILDRADQALGFLLAKRFDARRDLVTSGYSADWGDVSPVHADQQAIYLDDRTPLVTGLYTNALFVQAARCLGDLHQTLGDTAGAQRWRPEAAAVEAAVDLQLWQQARGFYKMHLPFVRTTLPDSHIFPTGGNAVALVAGLADQSRARKIFATAEARRRRYAVSTIAGTLLPPYRAGLFLHPAMREPWSYQNGGQWDWFGARLVLAAFHRGETDLGRRWLGELARKAERNGGLYEWHTREGEGRGSRTYAGSAGTLAAAVFEGLFGVSLSAGELSLTVRLGTEPGRIHLYQPVTDTFVAYRYQPSERALVLDYDSNHRQRGTVGLVVPSGRRVVRMALDARPIPVRTRFVGRDRYVVADTSWGPHRLEAILSKRLPAGVAGEGTTWPDQNRSDRATAAPRRAGATLTRTRGSEVRSHLSPGATIAPTSAPMPENTTAPIAPDSVSENHGSVPNQQGLPGEGWHPSEFDPAPQMNPPTAPTARPISAPRPRRPGLLTSSRFTSARSTRRGSASAVRKVSDSASLPTTQPMSGP